MLCLFLLLRLVMLYLGPSPSLIVHFGAPHNRT